MILTDEERERIARPFVRTIGGDHWYSGDDGIRDDGDIEKFAAAIEREVLRKLRERPAVWTLKSELDARETTCKGHLWFTDPQSHAWQALHIIPEVNE